MADPSNLGRYQIRRVLGKGAMGVVYEGFDPALNRPVAIKTILKSIVTDEESATAYSARFAREAKAVARLSHPNIVQVYDFGEENDVAYLVMEFIQGRELRSCFEARERFDAVEAVRIMGELLDALEFAHEAGVIHRDVKPANVMLDAQRRVKLADFGVARLQDGTDRSKGGTMVGTPAFMSPEQISGKKVDRRTDLFSAGVILYQLLTGERPFKGEGAWTVAKQIMQDEPPRPSTIAGKVSPAFDQIVNKALAKKPEQRFATAKEFAAAMQGALSGDPSAVTGSRGQEPRASDTELEFWRSIQNSNDPAEFEVYLKEFPTGIYADLARIKMAKLPRIAPGAVSVTAAPAPPLPAHATGEVTKLVEETARLEAELAQREAEYRKRAAEAEARRQAEEKAHVDAEARREAEARARAATEEKARLEPIEKAKKEAKAELAKREAEYRKREAEAVARAEAEAKATREMEERARKESEARAKAEAEARARSEAGEKARREADAKARAEAQARARRQAEELGKRQAEMQQREAELKRRAAQAPRSKAPIVPAAIALLIVVAGAFGAWYWSTSSDEARLAALTAALETATKATQELNLARQRQKELLKQVEVARLAEDEARAKGDQAKLKELQEQTKKAEAEAQKQAELVKQREAEAKKAEGAARITDAKKQADAARAAAEKAAAEKAVQEKAAAEKAAEEKAAALKAASRKGASQRAAQAETAVAGAEAAAPEELGLAGGVTAPLAAESSEPQLLNSESADTSRPEKAAMTTEFDGTWSGTVVPNGPYECPTGKFEITVNRGNFGGSVTWYGNPGASSLVRGAWHEGNSARIRLVPLRGPALAGSFVGEFKGQRLNAWVVAGRCTYELSLKRE
jgi:tRNA A-37 threonylcarbamoyl transferase component Bud32/membrane protein involved in colicin uptake